MWDRPLIADGHLYFMRSHDLQIYDIADLSDPQPVTMLNFDINGHIFAIVRGHLYLATNKGLRVYDLATPAKPRQLDIDIALPGKRLCAMYLEGDALYIFTDKGLAQFDVSDVTAPRLTETHSKIPLANRVLPRPDGWLAFWNATAMRQSGERLVDAWRIVAADPDAVAAEFAKTGLFTNRQLLGGAAANDQLAIFADGKTQIVDIADSANPKRLATVDYGGGFSSPVHAKRIFTKAGMLDLSDPANPKHQRLPGSRLSIDGATLYVVSGKLMDVFDLSGDHLKALRRVTLKRAPAVFAVHRGYLIESLKGGTIAFDKIGEAALESGHVWEVKGEKERACSLDVRDRVLYAVFGGSVRAYDLRDPAQPKRLASFTDARRFQFLDARDGVVFGAPSGRYSAAFDLQTSKQLEVGPSIIGARFIQILGERLLVGMPPGGVTILESPTLARLKQNRVARAGLEAKVAANPNDSHALADLAHLAQRHGATWKADLHIEALAGRELDEDTLAKVAAFEAERERRHQLEEAGVAFMRDAKERKMAYFNHDDNGAIIGLRIDRQQMFRRHLDYARTLPLSSLTMGREPLEVVDMAFAAGLPSLRYLHLRSLPVGNDSLAPLSGMKSLNTLKLDGNDLAFGGLSPIAGLDQMLSLSLEGTGIGDDDLGHLGGLKKLRHLSLNGTPVSDAGLAHLSDLHMLETLKLGDTAVAGSGLANLAGMSKLWSLELQQAPLETGMEHIAALTQLTHLDLSESTLTDEQAAHLAPLVNLQSLTLEGTTVSSAIVASLIRMSKLRRLNLAGTQVDDIVLATLAKLPALEDISLSGTTITDSGLAYLALLPKLRNLDIEDCVTITDEGIAKLANSASLQRLKAHNTALTHAGLRMLPKVKIDWKEREAPGGRERHQEAAQSAAIPAKLSFRLEANQLILIDADSGDEYARESPIELLGDDVHLRAFASWDGRCWVGSDRCLLRFEPTTRVWSRFAVDREHVDPPIRALEIVDAVLQVGFGRSSGQASISKLGVGWRYQQWSRRRLPRRPPLAGQTPN